MIKNTRRSMRFIELLMDGKFRKPEYIRHQQLGPKTEYTKEQSDRDLENYKFFMNTSCYDEIAKVKVKRYQGDSNE